MDIILSVKEFQRFSSFADDLPKVLLRLEALEHQCEALRSQYAQLLELVGDLKREIVTL